MEWMDQVVARLEPTTSDAILSAAAVWTVLAGSLLVVAVEPLWQVVRLGVTLVHELGHAVVGILVGRQFTGFVLRGDMSGMRSRAAPPVAPAGSSRRGPATRCPRWSGRRWVGSRARLGGAGHHRAPS